MRAVIAMIILGLTVVSADAAPRKRFYDAGFNAVSFFSFADRYNSNGGE